MTLCYPSWVNSISLWIVVTTSARRLYWIKDLFGYLPYLSFAYRSVTAKRAPIASIPIFTDDLLALLETLDIRKCCLMGHSIGGFISLQFSLDHPDMLSALVLVGTNSESYPKPPGFLEHRQKLHELARSQGMEAAFEYDAANNPQRIETFRKHPEQREMMRQRVLATSANGYIHAWKAIDRWKPLTPRLSEIQVPTLIYWGDEDATMADGVRALKKGIGNSELITVQSVGHSPHYESPRLFNRKLLEFLTRIGW